MRAIRSRPNSQGLPPNLFLSGENKGQSALEYAFIVACVVSALLAMHLYMSRALQGHYKQSMDEFSEAHYAPKQTSGDSTYTVNSVSESVTKTKSERQLFNDNCFAYDADGAYAEIPGCRERCDLNGNGVLEDNVYGTISTTYSGVPVPLNGGDVAWVGGITTTQDKNEKLYGP